jgi:hypothetical protein
MTEIPLLAHVALTEDQPDKGLTRGQLGTVVEHLGSSADPLLLVEFSSESGEAYAFAELSPTQVIVLHRQHPEAA